jgi:uncharacterized phage protein (TIGR01671 family)
VVDEREKEEPGMREIEFRGKRIDKNVRQENGEWEFGSINIHPLGCEIAKGHALIPVDPETVGQYTGLKDKNGVKIFEGDIVQDKYGNEGQIKYSGHFMDWRIVFHKGRPDLVNMYGARIFDWVYPKMTLKVISNIHDNPELIKTEAQ